MNLGHIHLLQANGALPYLAAAYALFFLAIFAYVMSISRRQARVQDDLALLRQAIDEETSE
jgi:CcmD family protein